MFRRSFSLPEGDQVDIPKSNTDESIGLLVVESPGSESKPFTLTDSWYTINQKTDNSWPSHLCHYVCNDSFHDLTKWEQDNPGLISMRDCFEDTVLHLAVWNGQKEMAAYLLKFIDINVRGFCGRTPLHWAVWCSYHDIVFLLLENCAHLNIQDKESLETPLHYAAIIGHTDVLQMLLEKRPLVEIGDIYGRTALHHATSQRHQTIIEMLISHGTDVNAQTKGGWTPLHYAINNREIATVATLLRADADVNIKDKDGISAYQLAYDSNLDITNLLLDSVGNLEVADDASYRIIERAMTLNVPDALRSLIVKDPRGRDTVDCYQDEELTVEYLQSRLDECIGRQGKTLFVNFRPLLPPNFRNFSVILVIFLCITKQKKFERLLLHPAVKVFLFWKWNQVAKYFYINLFFFLAICLNIILYQVIFYCNKTDDFTDICYLCYGLIIFSVFILVIRESVQVFVHPRSYAKNIENYYELALIVYLLVLLGWYPDFKTRTQISAIGNILIAISTTMVIGHHPWTTSAVHLLKMVTFKFFKYFVVYLVIILSFSLSFYQLYAVNKDSLESSINNATVHEETNLLDYPELSVLRTIGMFIGELNLTDFSSEKYSFVLIVMLISFIILVSIIILNLLNGLAISNVLDKEDLKISHIKSQLEYLYNISKCITLIIEMFEAPKCAKFVLAKKLPVTQLNVNYEVNNIFIVPSYIDCKTILLTSDQVLVRSNKIHRDAYERFKSKETKTARDVNGHISARDVDVQSKLDEIKLIILEVHRQNEMLMREVAQTKVDVTEVREKMLGVPQNKRYS